MINILVGSTLHWQDITACFGKTRGGGLCIFINNCWCTISKEVSRFCSPEVEYFMISCRPHYIPREFSPVFIVAVYIPPQWPGTLVQGNVIMFYLIYISMLNVQPKGKQNSRPPLLHTQRRVQSSPSPSIWKIWPWFYPPDSCLQAKIKAGSTSDLVNKKSGQMKQMLNYRTVLLSQTGICSGILPMALRSTPHCHWLHQ